MKVSLPLVFIYVSVLSSVLPLLVGLVGWQRLTLPLRLLVALCAASLICDNVLLWFTKMGINSWLIGNSFLLLQCAILSIILVDPRDGLFKILIVLVLIFGLVDLILVHGPGELNTYSTYASAMLMIIVAIRFLHLLMAEMSVEHIQQLPKFWLSFGVMVYYGGTLFLFLFNNYIHDHLPQVHKDIWILHNLLNTAKNIFFLLALWVNSRSKAYYQ